MIKSPENTNRRTPKGIARISFPYYVAAVLSSISLISNYIFASKRIIPKLLNRTGAMIEATTIFSLPNISPKTMTIMVVKWQIVRTETSMIK